MSAVALKILFPQNVLSIIVARFVYTCPDCLWSLSAMANDIFQDTVDQIENFYQEHDYELGWRFLTCPKSVLKNNPKIAFITLNPGGTKKRDDHSSASCEDGNPIYNESWKNKKPGESALQKQIQKMFGKIREKTNYPGNTRKLIESTLCGYFVPFRSRRREDLKYEKEAFDFGEKIWRNILETVQPELFVCIDKKTAIRLRKIIANAYNLRETPLPPFETGWGKTTADIIEFGSKAEVKLLRLPHLSSFKLFSRKECEEKIDNIFTQFCRKT